MLRGRPCGSRTRAKQRWSRRELQNLAKVHNVPTQGRNMDDLCLALRQLEATVSRTPPLVAPAIPTDYRILQQHCKKAKQQQLIPATVICRGRQNMESALRRTGDSFSPRSPHRPRVAKKSQYVVSGLNYRELQGRCKDARDNGDIPAHILCRGRKNMEAALQAGTQSSKPRSSKTAGRIRIRKPLKLMPSSYLSGISTFSKWRANKPDRTLYLASDIHRLKGECRSTLAPSEGIEHFIRDLLDDYDNIDIFIEYRPALQLTKRPFLAPIQTTTIQGHGFTVKGKHVQRVFPYGDSLSRTYNVLEGCLELVKNCAWTTNRIHSVDIRNTIYGSTLSEVPFTRTLRDNASEMCFKKNKISKSVTDFLSVIYPNGRYDAAAYLKLMKQWLNDKRTRINRGYITLPRRTQGIINDWLVHLVAGLQLLLRGMAMERLQVVRDGCVIIPDIVTAKMFKNGLVKIQSIQVDLFFVVRYLRQYDVADSGHLAYARRALYYAGASHIRKTEPLLRTLGFKRVWKSTKTSEILCQNIADIPHPYFP